MTAHTRISALVLSAGLILTVALIPVGRRNSRQIVAIALSKNGTIAAGTSSGRIAIWSGSALNVREVGLSNIPLNDLRFSSDERLLAVGGPDLTVFSLANLTARTIRKDGRNYGTVRFSPDDASILTITGAATIEMIDIPSGSARMTVCCSTIYGEVAFAPDDMSIVNAGHWPRIWNLYGDRTGNLTSEHQVETFGPISFIDSDRVLMGSQDGRVYIWNLTTHELVGKSPALSAYVNTVAILDNGWIAYASFGRAVHLWNVNSGLQKQWNAAYPTSNLIATLDGASVLFGTSSGTVETRSAASGGILRQLELP